MSDARKQILELIRAGKLAVGDAESLLDALKSERTANLPDPVELEAGEGLLTFLTIRIERGDMADFSVRIPVALLRSGLSVADFVPQYARDAIDEGLRRQGVGFQLAALTSENVDAILAQLDGLDLHWDGADVRLRIEGG